MNSPIFENTEKETIQRTDSPADSRNRRNAWEYSDG